MNRFIQKFKNWRRKRELESSIRGIFNSINENTTPERFKEITDLVLKWDTEIKSLK